MNVYFALFDGEKVIRYLNEQVFIFGRSHLKLRKQQQHQWDSAQSQHTIAANYLIFTKIATVGRQ